MRSRRMGLWLAIALLVVLCVPSAVAADGLIEVGTPANVVYAPLGLFLRYGQGLDQEVQTSLYNGQTVYPVEGEESVWNNGLEWSRVVVVEDDTVQADGYVASAHLSNYGGYVEPWGGTYTGGEENIIKVTAGIGLRLRSEAGLDGDIERIVPYGTLFQSSGTTVDEDGYAWTEVYVGEETFYCAKGDGLSIDAD